VTARQGKQPGANQLRRVQHSRVTTSSHRFARHSPLGLSSNHTRKLNFAIFFCLCFLPAAAGIGRHKGAFYFRAAVNSTESLALSEAVQRRPAKAEP